MNTVNDGATARTFTRSAELIPAVMLLDLNIQGLSGFNILGEVNADPQLMAISVVLLTSSDVPTAVVRAWELGALAKSANQATA